MIKKFNDRGVALFVTLSLWLLLCIGAIVILLTAYNYTNLSETDIKRLKAFTLAEAGVHYANWKIRIGEDDDGDPIDFADGETHILVPPISIPADWVIQVEVEDAAMTGRKTIRSTVSYPKVTLF